MNQDSLSINTLAKKENILLVIPDNDCRDNFMNVYSFRDNRGEYAGRSRDTDGPLVDLICDDARHGVVTPKTCR